ncbi:hypothetical protein PRUPE_7G007700 [Prunus persica]|uniref:Glycoside hydrolase family 3 N-terminal domain-containing protein n=1 Tax=Prunus persica TaxID=3760 RepID=A0A251N6R5_PRUPE|nr:hypothetical protein PRUPE_7G007700 [Prunus persica]
MARLPVFLAGLLLLCFCSIAIAEAEYIKYKDPKQPLNTRIKDHFGGKDWPNGSILSGVVNVRVQKGSAETWVKLVNDFQKASLSTRLGIPLIYGIDAVHGHNSVYKATIFPHNVGLGATRQVCRDPRWGRCYESNSEDPKLVQAMTEIIPGLQGEIPANSTKGVPFVAGK